MITTNTVKAAIACALSVALIVFAILLKLLGREKALLATLLEGKIFYTVIFTFLSLITLFFRFGIESKDNQFVMRGGTDGIVGPVIKTRAKLYLVYPLFILGMLLSVFAVTSWA